MKKLLKQIGIILILSLTIGMTYNRFLKSPLPILKPYKTDTVQENGEDLSVYYREIDAETLKAVLDADMAVLVDARTRENYLKGHIPGAISLPISEFNRAYDRTSSLLVKDKSIIIYCTGGHCLDSSLLAKELTKKGYREIFVYKGGIEEWQALGNPVQGAEPTAGGSENE
jgi:rhodanese-related sulfurtransferase